MFRDRDGWRVAWRVDGKKTSKYFDAKKDAQRFELELASGVIPKAEAADLTFADFASRWLERYCKVEKAPSQWYVDESTIRVHLVPALGQRKMRQITEDELLQFRIEVKAKVHPKTKRPIAPKTANLILGLLKKMFVVAKQWKLIVENPATELKMFTVPEQRTDYWTAEERDFFLNFAGQEDPRLVELVVMACHSGMRRGEIAGLKRGQIDFEHRMIRIDGVYCFRAEQRLDRTKNGRIGHVPMNEALFAALQRYKLLPPEQAIFPPERFAHLAQTLKKVSRKVGAKPIRYHDLRHTFASNLVTDGVELYTVQKLLRHETAAMTQRYAHLAPATMRDAVDRLSRKGVPQETEKPGKVSKIK